MDDCESVFASFRDHPQFKKDGYVRLFPGSKEYDAIPNSIRGFDPVYVTIEENPFGIDRPLNIGLCKNGFGGFHMGVRVFRDDPKIPASLNRERITPTIYLWVEET